MRVDSAIYAGYTVPPHYDSLVAKVIVHGRNRQEAIMRLRRALEELHIGGIKTTAALHRRLVAAADIVNGTYDIRWLENFVAETSA